MVRLRARKSDEDLGPVTDSISRVEGRVVTASSHGVRGRHSTSDIPPTPAPFGPGIYYDPGPVLLPNQTVCTRPYRMTLMDLLRHYLHHMIHMHMLLLCLSVCLAKIGHTVEFAQIVKEPDSRLSMELKATYYVQYLLGTSLFTDKSGNIVLAKLWPIVKDVWSSGMDVLVLSYVCPSSETRSEVVQAIYPEVGSMHSSTSYSPSRALQECVYRGIVAGGTFTSIDGDMDQCPCCITLLLYRRLQGLVSPLHSLKDIES
ncbi:hypothetical protein M9H77_22325 [Catharanthus roseus]|uniref:Uncharacterized protein n=1 Tax=Catharanthus roseus TaxID=4058 RepID=A0ACC0ASQ8_CATRO|nr:hypothetical protein M9H77_22325 [Catharanthus roseus]